MAMGVISDDELARELANISGPVPARKLPPDGINSSNARSEDGPISSNDAPSNTPVIEILPSPGRSVNDVNVPNSLRKLIGETGAIEGRQEAIQLANMFGVSPSAASAYAKGTTSTASYGTPKLGILAHINKTKERITKRAHNTLLTTLGEITPEKLKDVKARDLAGIAKDVSVVIKNMEPEHPEEQKKDRPVFVFYKPEMHTENHYERMKVDE